MTELQESMTKGEGVKSRVVRSSSVCIRPNGEKVKHGTKFSIILAALIYLCFR